MGSKTAAEAIKETCLNLADKLSDLPSIMDAAKKAGEDQLKKEDDRYAEKLTHRQHKEAQHAQEMQEAKSHHAWKDRLLQEQHDMNTKANEQLAALRELKMKKLQRELDQM